MPEQEDLYGDFNPFLNTILNSAQDAIISAGADGHISQFNPAAEKIFGYKMEEVTGKPLSVLMPEKYIIAHKTGFASYLDKGKGKVMGEGPVVLEGKKKDGSIFPIELSLSAGKLNNNKIFTAIIRDISGRKEMEDCMKENQAFLDSIIENIPNMIFIKDAKELRFVRFNKAGEELLGYSRKDLIGKNDFDFFPKEQAEFFIEKDREVLSNKKLLDIPEEPINTKNKGKRFLHTQKIPILDENDRPIYLLGISEDITERKKAREDLKKRTEQLARSNEELEHFAYIASHDLQEPLRMISGFTDLLSKQYKEKLDKNADEYIEFITDGADRMRNLINALLEYSRLNTDDESITKVDMNKVLDDVKINLKRIIQDSEAEIFSGTLPLIYAEPTQMQQLFQNLISNAIKFRKKDESPRIDIRSEENKDHWLFIIKDNGIGIAEQFTDRIFKIFQRLHGAHEYQGTGIGLAISKKIVERHDGNIWFEKKPGGGTSFFFTISKIEKGGIHPNEEFALG